MVISSQGSDQNNENDWPMRDTNSNNNRGSNKNSMDRSKSKNSEAIFPDFTLDRGKIGRESHNTT